MNLIRLVAVQPILINVVLPSSVNCPLQAPMPHCINNVRNSGLGFWQQHKFPDNIRFIKGHSPWCSLQLGVHFLDWRFRLKYQEILYRRNKCYYNSFHNWNVWRACCGMDEIPVVLDWHDRWCHSSIRPWGQKYTYLNFFRSWWASRDCTWPWAWVSWCSWGY